MLVLERKEILRREAVSGFGACGIRGFAGAGDRAQEHFLREFPPRPGGSRPCTARWPASSHRALSGAGLSAAGCQALLSPGDGAGTLGLLPAPGRDGWETGRTGSPAAEPGGRRAEAVGVGHRRGPGLAFDRRGIVLATGSGITTGFSNSSGERSAGRLPGQASGFRTCRSTRGSPRHALVTEEGVIRVVRASGSLNHR